METDHRCAEFRAFQCTVVAGMQHPGEKQDRLF